MKSTTDFDSSLTPSDRLREYFSACIVDNPPVAEHTLVNDSQTGALLETIFSKFTTPTIVDVGCGKLRLLYALLSKHKSSTWRYIGLDVVRTEEAYPEAFAACANIEPSGKRWFLEQLSKVRTSDIEADVCVLCNAIHEMPIAVIASVIEDCRRILKPHGRILLMDTAFVLEGEPKFVPVVPSDLEVLIGPYSDRSFRTKSGLLITFGVGEQPNIPPFFRRRSVLFSWMSAKRDVLASIRHAVEFPQVSVIAGEYLNGTDRTFDYTYLNTIVANAASRVVEERYSIGRAVSREEYSAAGRAILRAVEESLFGGSALFLRDLFQTLGREHTYDAIDAALEMLGRPQIPSVLMAAPLITRGTLEASEFFDYIIDRQDRHGLFGDEYLTDVLHLYSWDWQDERM